MSHFSGCVDFSSERIILSKSIFVSLNITYSGLQDDLCHDHFCVVLCVAGVAIEVLSGVLC